MVNLGVYRVCCGVKKRVGGPLGVYRVDSSAIQECLIATKSRLF